MAYSYLGYSESHAKEFSTSSRFHSTANSPTGGGDNLNDPHDKLGLTARVRQKQFNYRAGFNEMHASAPGSDLNGHAYTGPKSSKGKCLKDYTRPEKKAVIEQSQPSENPHKMKKDVAGKVNQPWEMQLKRKSMRMDADESPIRSSRQYGAFY